MTDEDLFKNARTNHLLRVLKPDSLASLAPEMQVRTLSAREPVIRRGETIERVFFPLSCVLSTVAHGSNAELVEVAAVGNEGMAGVSVYLGISRTPTLETFIQIPGDALDRKSTRLN